MGWFICRRSEAAWHPVIEAFYAGTPAVLTDTHRNRMTAGDAACYISGPEPDVLADTLNTLLSNADFRQELIGCCRRRVERITGILEAASTRKKV